MTKRNPSSNGLVLIYVRAGADGHKSRHSIPLSCKVSDLKNKVKISHRVDGDVRLIFLGRLLEDNKTVDESGLFDKCTVTLVATNKYSLCPDSAELADMENGAPLDAVISPLHEPTLPHRCSQQPCRAHQLGQCACNRLDQKQMMIAEPSFQGG